MKTVRILATWSCCAFASGAGADELCLITGSHCVELREYLSAQPESSTIKDVTERVGDILVANYYPAYPESDEMVCVPHSSLVELLKGKRFEVIRTEFKFPSSVVPPLIEYALEDGSRYCYLDQGNT